MPSKADFRVVCCPPGLFAQAWAHCGAMLLRGLAAADMDLQETMDRVVGGECHLWLVMDGYKVKACFLTELYEDEGKQIVGICGLSGENPMAWASAMFQRVEQFAKATGGKAVRFGGKVGWQRLAPDYSRVGKRGAAEIFERAIQ